MSFSRSKLKIIRECGRIPFVILIVCGFMSPKSLASIYFDLDCCAVLAAIPIVIHFHSFCRPTFSCSCQWVIWFYWFPSRSMVTVAANDGNPVSVVVLVPGLSVSSKLFGTSRIKGKFAQSGSEDDPQFFATHALPHSDLVLRLTEW